VPASCDGRFVTLLLVLPVSLRQFPLWKTVFAVAAPFLYSVLLIQGRRSHANDRHAA